MVEPRAKRTGSCSTAFTVFRINIRHQIRIKKNKTCARVSLSRAAAGRGRTPHARGRCGRPEFPDSVSVARSAGSSSSARPSTVMTWRIRMARCAQLRPPPVRLSLADSAPAAHAATIVLVHRPTRESRPCDRSHANDVDQYVEVDPELHHPTSTLPPPKSPAPLDRARLPRSRHDTGAACRMFLQAPSHPPQALIQPSHHGRPRRSDRYRSYALRACHAIHTQQESRRPERASWRATLLPRHAHVSCSSEWLRHTSASASTGADGDGGDASQSHAATLFSFVSNSSSSNSSSGMVHGVKSSSAASPKL
jgi:hypothetical protein